MNKFFLILIISSLFTLQSALSQNTEDREQLTKMLHNFMEGASNNDKDTHENFWAEDLIYTSSNGTRFGKAQIMAGFENETEVSDTPKTIYTAEEIQINLYDDMAIVAFKMKGTTGVEVQYYLNSGTFLKRKGRWQVVNWQATKINK
tara:strand:+ start:6428 stop:6868 length:441 start_codon:yes stop_codon:yes gene_type:complete